MGYGYYARKRRRDRALDRLTLSLAIASVLVAPTGVLAWGLKVAARGVGPVPMLGFTFAAVGWALSLLAWNLARTTDRTVPPLTYVGLVAQVPPALLTLVDGMANVLAGG